MEAWAFSSAGVFASRCRVTGWYIAKLVRFEKRPGRRLGRIWSADFEDASRKQVNDVLDALAYVLNVIDAHYSGFGTYFKVGYGPGGATSLLYALDDGLRAARKRQERLAGGLFDKDDRPRAL